MRTTLIAGNWKMNMGPRETEAFFENLSKEKLASPKKTEALICPPFISLISAATRLASLPWVKIGAQNVHFENNGAYTGEISTSMLQEAGCTHVIIGHSERREYFGETDTIIQKKTRKVLESGLTPITCVGEVLEERKSGSHFDVVTTQVKGAFEGFSTAEMEATVIAYEPVWAIGTGETASPEQAQEMHAHIRSILAEMFGSETAENVRILYGGSMKPENAGELLAKRDVDGGLIGGASLAASSFAELIRIAEAS